MEGKRSPRFFPESAPSDLRTCNDRSLRNAGLCFPFLVCFNKTCPLAKFTSSHLTLSNSPRRVPRLTASPTIGRSHGGQAFNTLPSSSGERKRLRPSGDGNLSGSDGGKEKPPFLPRIGTQRLE